MSLVAAKGINGHGVNELQPINGALGALETFPVTFWTSSQVFGAIQGVSSRVSFWESSETYLVIQFDDESAIGETICVPNPIRQRDCEVIC